MAPVNSAIKIYCRVKPIPEPLISYDVLTTENAEEMLQLSLREEHPGVITQLYLNNKPEQYKFRFTKVFDRTSRQDYIFQEVARPVIDSALQGYNGTIFAYGQTGTGKTYTMTGSRSTFNERGVIPRTLEYIFQKFDENNNPSKVRNVFVSYLEIYNEAGYDLLNPSTITGRMDDLGRVSLMEDGSQQMHLRNLSVHSIESVEEATQFLYLGDHNRTIAETPLNEVSTRSHCIFTIHLNMRDVNTSLTTRSKLHLVDLAGSERVSTISTTSQLATEARHINLALHYLEQVIVALGDTNRSHIPYRNSMMTSVLRDSLGGNCMTSMIATISLDPRNTQETLSTCRFAQRVAMVTNAVQRNEDLDPNIIITQLKSEVKKLREIIENSSIKPIKESTAPLTEDELAICSYGVQQFLAESGPNVGLSIPCDMRMIQECFRLLKLHIPSNNSSIESYPQNSSIMIVSSGPMNEDLGQMSERNLQQLLARRDAEIKVLMDMIRKEKTKRSQTATPISAKPSLESLVNPRGLNSSRESNGKNHENIFTQLGIPETQKSNTRLTIKNSPPKNTFDDTPGDIPESHHSDPVCETPPPSREEPLFDENSMTKDFTEPKRIALVTFINKYEGTAALEIRRAKLFEKRAEIRTLLITICSYKQNIEVMKKIAETTDDSDTRLDFTSLSISMSNQQRTLDIQETHLKTLRQEVYDIEMILKIEYKKLLVDFEEWWTISQKIGVELDERKNQDDEFENVGTMFKKSRLEERTIISGRERATNIETTQDHYKSDGDKAKPKIPPELPKPITNFSPYDGLPRYPRAPPSTTVEKARERERMLMFNEKALLKLNISEAGDDEEENDDIDENVPMTGDTETDQEILQFLQSRKQVFQIIKKQQEHENLK